jgi:hypothetical protein
MISEDVYNALYEANEVYSHLKYIVLHLKEASCPEEIESLQEEIKCIHKELFKKLDSLYSVYQDEYDREQYSREGKLASRLTVNQEVVGSTPTSGATSNKEIYERNISCS